MASRRTARARPHRGACVAMDQPASHHEIERLRLTLLDALFTRSKPGFSEQRTLRAAFTAIDSDGSGEVSFQEFVGALSRFGLQLQEPGGRVQGGVRKQCMWGLFQKFNRDQNDTLSYAEFCDGLFRPGVEHLEEIPYSNLKLHPNGKQVMVLPEDDRAPSGSAGNAASSVNPWLPTLTGQESMDPRFSRPNSAKPAVRVLSLANPKHRLPQRGVGGVLPTSAERVFG